ncbi:hypothetical protein [Kitasatospora sp. NPDC059599]|uniref:hypothetical protein n=1 Tax=Kitasatospora sp. NPDC059599 TaxID=3346880 RepID=UPI00369A74AD
MAPRNRPDGPYPYPTHPDWVAKLCEAVANTCKAEGLIPLPEAAVKYGLAPALGAGEARRVVETQKSGLRVLRQAAFHIEGRDTPQAMLFLNVELHGAGSVQWLLNDRTRSSWVRPTPETTTLQAQLVAAEISLTRAKAGLERAKEAVRGTRSADQADKDAADTALKAAEQHHQHADDQHKQAERALNYRRPLPRISAHHEADRPTAALTTEVLPTEVVASVQQYATTKLRERGRLRPYDLEESLVQEGQRDRATVVLQRISMTDPDGTLNEAWRAVRVTGNNRAECCLRIFGLEAHQIITGVPQPMLLLDGEKEDSALILRGLGEILRRLSARLNTEYANEDRNIDGIAERAKKIAQVPVRVVIGAAEPERLEASLRDLNAHDHLRGQLAFVDDERALALWSSIVKAYQDSGLLGHLLLDHAAQDGCPPDAQLDTDAVADALLGSGLLDPLTPLLPATEPVTTQALRDAAIRCTTVMMFPPVPPRPANHIAGTHRQTGRYWPIVRKCLMEAPWSVGNGKDGQKVRRRTEVWAAAIGQLFVHRGNLLAVRAVFAPSDVQEGVRPDRRSLADILRDCENGDRQAWSTLVRHHLLAGLVNAPEKFITSGQGSEAGDNRKGVRRTPLNAIAALTRAFDKPDHPHVTRQLLLSFARSVLHAPDAPEGVLASPAGTFLAPDAHGQARPDTLADKEWFDDLFPKFATTTGEEEEAPNLDEDEEEDDLDEGEGPESSTYTRDQYENQNARMARLRLELISQLKATRAAFDGVAEQTRSLTSVAEDARSARILAGAETAPVDTIMLHLQDIKAMDDMTKALSESLMDAFKVVMEL